MASLNAITVATKVKSMVEKGGKVNLGKAIREQGYSEACIANPSKVTGTKSYKAVMVPFLQRLERHRDRIMEAMEAKDLDLEDYRILSESYDRMTKNLNLLQGKSTDNVAVEVRMVSYDTSALVQSLGTSPVVQDPPLVLDDNVD